MPEHLTDLPVHPELGTRFNYGQAMNDMTEALSGRHAAPAACDIARQCLQLASLLLRKNTAYGDSALSPVAIFTRDVDPVQRINVRIDDKLARVGRGHHDGEDVEMDLAGYLVLKRIAQHQALLASRAAVTRQVLPS